MAKSNRTKNSSSRAAQTGREGAPRATASSRKETTSEPKAEAAEVEAPEAVSLLDLEEAAPVKKVSEKLLKTVPVSRSPHSVAVSPDGRFALVAGYEANTADLIDAKTMRRTGPFRVGDKPQSVAFARDSAHAYVVNEGTNTVSVLNGRTGVTTSVVRVGTSPRSIAVSPDGRLAYVSNGDDNTISVLRVGE